MKIYDEPAMQGYKQILLDMLSVQFPELAPDDILNAVNYSIEHRYKSEQCSIENNYNKRNVETDLLGVINYIIEREPIITAWGVLFKKKGSVPNPLLDMVEGFLNDRDVYKAKMKSYPKGTYEFSKYNLSQILEKLNANATLNI